MNTVNVTLLPASEKSKRMAELERDVNDLLDIFRELHEVERITGRAGLSARVRVSLANILLSAGRAACV